ncbi:MAG: hypothetical protein ACJAWV_003959, partial [Flammeovirgaceae bacterium]
MKYTTSIKIVLLLFFSLVISKLEAETIELQSQTVVYENSLFIKKNNSEKCMVIQAGEKIKLRLVGKKTEIREFKSMGQGTLTIISNGVEKSILVSEIEKIKAYSSSSGRVIGGMLLAAGVGGIAFGGLSLVVGISALLAGSLGAIILVAVPFLLGGGFGLYKAGDRLSGKKVGSIVNLVKSRLY